MENAEWNTWLTGHIKSVLRHPLLEFAKPATQALEKALDEYEVLAYVVIIGPALLLVALLSLLLGGKSSKKVRGGTAVRAEGCDLGTFGSSEAMVSWCPSGL